MLQAKNLSRNYGDVKAVEEVSFSVEPGEVVGLLGHNGAGKSTIMKMLTGFIEPCQGEVLVDGMSILEEPELVRESIGYLPESPPIYPELSVLDYLFFAARMRGRHSEDEVYNALSATNLESKALEPIATLSRGFKQRVGVAQAILHRPRLLILDEPSNGLDPKQNQEMRDLILTLAKEATVILSTHVMQEVDAICDRVLIMSAGKLTVDENLRDLTEGSSIALSTTSEAPIERLLANVAIVSNLKELDQGRWEIGVKEDISTAIDRIARACVESDVPIYGIAPKKLNLETLFRDVSEAEVSK
ncbi:MAG: multidrug ABC transporter ATP-binding protein [Gammaproteobacteria bacterium]|nr:multidrug ABC transporter ATP-binding protein [Gammaproteobacteria bacterium]